MAKNLAVKTLLHLVVACLLSLVPVAADCADATGPMDRSYFTLSLEELSNILVTSPSRFKEGLLESPHAVWVITAEDIRRSGARSIPEALALAPGVYVAYKSGNDWIVNIGGLALEEYSNKLLVLVDNVTVYSNLFGNVDWNLLPVSLEEVERIEVIRGPGGVLYGANAVNGVIGIFTRGADTREPPRVALAADGEGARSLQAALGVAPQGTVAFRVSTSYEGDDGFDIASGADLGDYQRVYTASARASIRLGPSASLGIDGWYLGGKYLVPPSAGPRSHFLTESLRHPQSGIVRLRYDLHSPLGTQVYLQAYALHQAIQEEEGTALSPLQDSRTLDLEFQAQRPLGEDGRHALILGGGHRKVDAEFDLLSGQEGTCSTSNLFVYDRWQVRPRVQVGAGLKWEAMDTTRETFPSRLDLMWRPSEAGAFRLGLSTSYRSPTFLENFEELYLEDFAGPGTSLELLSNPDLDPEKVTTAEVGYRGTLASGLLLDVSWRRMEYRDLIVHLQVSDFPNLGYDFFNMGRATVDSAEVGLTAQLSDRLRATLGAGVINSELDSAARYQYEPEPFYLAPEAMATAGLSFSGLSGVEADLRGYFTRRIEALEVGDRWRVDLRLAKRFVLSDGDLRLALACRNLTDEEFAQPERDVDVPASYRFSIEWLGL